jgi:ATP synthase protein I
VADNELSTIRKVLGYQILIIITTAFGFTIAVGWQRAIFSALGGAAAFLPNLYFALRVYKSAGQEAKKIVGSFYAGESGKLLLTAALFMMIFQIPNIEIIPLLTGYVTALSVFWFALLMR